MNKNIFNKLKGFGLPKYWEINRSFMDRILTRIGVTLPDDVSNEIRKNVINEMLGFEAIRGNGKNTNYKYWLTSKFFTRYYKL